MLSFKNIENLATYLIEELELDSDKEELYRGFTNRPDMTAKQMLSFWMQSKIIDWQLENKEEFQKQNPDMQLPFKIKINS